MMRRLFFLTLAVHPAASQSITIDWTGESGHATPHLRGIDGELLTKVAQPPEEDNYEESWWRDGFGDDTQEHWFAASRVPRPRRPESMVKLGHSVGTVYTHAQSGALGVIIGWDARTRAPKSWLGPNLPGHRSWAERLRRLYAPHYSVLEELHDANGRVRFQQRYIVAHCLEAGENDPPCLRVERSPVKRLQHPDIDKYFSAFSPEAGYLPSADLQALYPDG